MKKTLWQKIYSFFGFWFYYTYINRIKYKVLYWCSFPWKGSSRKIDILKIKCGRFEKLNEIFFYKRKVPKGWISRI